MSVAVRLEQRQDSFERDRSAKIRRTGIAVRAFHLGKNSRDGNFRLAVDHQAERAVFIIVDEEDDGLREVGIGIILWRDEQLASGEIVRIAGLREQCTGAQHQTEQSYDATLKATCHIFALLATMPKNKGRRIFVRKTRRPEIGRASCRERV